MLEAQGLGQPHHLLLVGVTDDEGALTVGEHLLERDDLADALELEGVDDVHRFVEHDLLAAREAVELDRRAHGDAQLATTGEDVHRVVVVASDEHAEAGGRLGEAIDLFFERNDLVAGFLQRCHETVVLRRDRGKICLQVGDALLESTGVTRRLCQPATERLDFILECTDLGREVLAALAGTARLVACLTMTVHGWHGGHLPSGAISYENVCLTLPSARRSVSCTLACRLFGSASW